MKNRDLQHYLDIVIVLTQKELKVRYKSSYLGYLWSIAQPLALSLIFFTVFKVVMRVPMENYALFLVAGLFPWQCFANSVNTSSTTFLANASIIKKVCFPRDLAVLAVILQDLFHFLAAIPVIVGFMFYYGLTPSWTWIYGIPLFLAPQFLIMQGVSLAIASINLFFRDLERLVILFTMMAFYVTPVIYPESMVPDKYRVFLQLNPMASLIGGWRTLFLSGRVDLGAAALSLAYALGVFALGYAVYRKLSWRFAEVL
jgi:lipopolysaccharide transport system permease protein